MDTLARSVSPAHLRQQDSGFTAWAKRRCQDRRESGPLSKCSRPTFRVGRFSFLIHRSSFHGLLNHDAKRGASSFGGAVTRSSDAGGLPRRLPRTPFPGSLHDCWWEGRFSGRNPAYGRLATLALRAPARSTRTRLVRNTNPGAGGWHNRSWRRFAGRGRLERWVVAMAGENPVWVF